MAGLACADALKHAGHSVALFDKGRGPGGRMSARRLPTPLGEVTIDHGAQYFTARDPAFKHLVAIWRDVGIALPWPLAGADAWIGVPGMNAIVKQMASAHAVTWGQHVAAMARKNDKWWLAGTSGEIGPFDAVVLAIPAEQAATILSLHDFSMARIALLARSQPCWTSMFVFDGPLEDLPSIIRNRGAISWAARNSAKPGRRGPEAWVVQASCAWSLAHLEESSEHISAMLCDALSQAMESTIPEPVAAVSHRWRYALSAGTGDGALWDQTIGLGVCGDWLLGPRVECAWLSGRMLAQRCVGSARDPELADAVSEGSLEASRQIV
ncbi:MAG: FAD-dependent oxidoreductase [Pseudomonadota bacterium]|nr:FAD-dependent oxidoreductase [Pseudomonadota bacterium]